MRQMSGLELQERLAEEPIHPPVIIITGHGDVPMAVRAVKNGAVDFIEKPFNDQALLDAVHRAIDIDAEQRGHALEIATSRSASPMRAADQARARGARPDRRRQAQQGHRRGPRHQPIHGRGTIAPRSWRSSRSAPCRT
jgi:DNA-binding NtrC family response regulator